MFTYLISGSNGLSSAFEDAVMGLSPTAAYLFRDSDYSSQITDSSGNGYHLAKQHATAQVGAALRSTHPGGIILPAFTTWATDSVVYTLAATSGLDQDIGGATSASMVIGLQLSGAPVTNDYRIFGVGTHDGAASGSNDSMVAIAVNTGVVQFKERHSSGIGANTDTSPVTGEPVVYTNRFHYSTAPERHLDRGTESTDTEPDTGALSGASFEDLDRSTFIGGRTSSNTSVPYSIIIDHISVFVPSLSVANLDTLRGLYRAEIA